MAGKKTVQSLIEFFDQKAPQSYFCMNCDKVHKAGECGNEGI
jgi:hypothetical protein